MIKVKPADQVEGVPGGVNTSLQDSQSRTLHVQAGCKVRDDGVKAIHENLFRPIGSEFQFLSDEAPESGGKGLAPDAITYLAAGLGFCFMTQFGRYASITKKLAALIIEALETADARGDEEWMWSHLVDLLTSIDEPFLERLISGTAKHAARRLDEMETVARFMADLSVSPHMTASTVDRLRLHGAGGAGG